MSTKEFEVKQGIRCFVQREIERLCGRLTAQLNTIITLTEEIDGLKEQMEWWHTDRPVKKRSKRVDMESMAKVLDADVKRAVRLYWQLVHLKNSVNAFVTWSDEEPKDTIYCRVVEGAEEDISACILLLFDMSLGVRIVRSERDTVSYITSPPSNAQEESDALMLRQMCAQYLDGFVSTTDRSYPKLTGEAYLFEDTKEAEGASYVCKGPFEELYHVTRRLSVSNMGWFYNLNPGGHYFWSKHRVQSPMWPFLCPTVYS